MEATWIFRKTERGQLAIKERSSFLTPQLRSLLIMLDGVKSVADLRKFGGVMGDVDSNLGKLADEGLIDAGVSAATSTPASVSEPSKSDPAAAGAPAAGAGAPLITLAEFQRQATKVILEGIGPMGDPICERLERAKTQAEVLKAASLAVQLLKDARRPEAIQKLEALAERLG